MDDQQTLRVRLDCMFCVWRLNCGIHGIVHVNEDKRVLNEDKRTVVVRFICHVEVILQNYFQWNLSCHVMSVQGPAF